MADPNYTPTKVLLHDPAGTENPKSLYAITGLPAIMAGCSGDAASQSILDSGTTKINSAYLGIVSGNYVISDKLQFAYVEGATNASGGPVLDNSDLNIFDGTGKIKSDILPSYVDDVVEVPVIDNISSATGPLVILQTITSGVASYTFWEPGTGAQAGQYVLGGGEASKIYIAETTGGTGDGSIYRCVTGSTTTAIKISENPYAVDTTRTNGVYLNTDDGVLTAKADRATFYNYGTVQISPDAVNNVKLQFVTSTIDSAAVTLLSVSAGMVNGAVPGLVYAAATDAGYSSLQSAYGDVSVVPTAKYMRDYVSSFVPTVAVATSNNLGIVQIGTGINVSSGVISVPNASANVNGVIKIVDTINTTAEGNSSKAVTQGGIVQYVTGLLASYQPTITGGAGIDVSNNTVSAKVYGAIVFSGTSISARNATADATGVLRVTSDQSVIANGSNTLGGDPVAVNPVAVSKYVSGVSSAIRADVNGALGTMWDNVINSAYTAGSGLSDTLIQPTTGSAYRRFDVVTTGAAYVIPSGDNAGKLTVSAATVDAAGVVQITSTSAGINDAANAGAVPTAAAVSSYVSGATAGVYGAASALAHNYSSALDSSLIYGFAGVYTSIYNSIFKGIDPVYVTSSTSNVSHGLHFVTGSSGGVIQPLYLSSVELGAPGYLDVHDASSDTKGVVRTVASGAHISESIYSAHVPTVSAVKEYVATAVSNAAPIVSSSGISVLSSGSSVTIGAKVTGAIDFNTSGQMYVKAASAGASGIVNGLVTASGGMEVSGSASAVPTAGAVAGYVADKIAGIPTISSGNGISITDSGSSKIIAIKATGAIVYDGTGIMYVQAAAAGVSGIVSGLVTASSGMESAGSANAVPTAAAVKEYVIGKVGDAKPIGSSSGILISASTNGTQYIGASIKENNALTFDGNGAMYVQAAATGLVAGVVSGLVTGYEGIEIAGSANAVPTAAAVAGYVADKLTGITPISQGNGITITESGGSKTIAVNNTGPIIFSGSAVTVQTAGVGTLGVVMVDDTTGGLTVTSSGYIQANTAGAILISGNAITARDAAVGSTGVVAIKNTSAGIVGAENVNDVPNCAGVVSYVTGYVASAGLQKSIVAGNGLTFGTGTASNTLSVVTTNPLVISGSAVAIQTAVAQTGASLTSAALGAVYVRGAVRSASVISEDSQNLQNNTVPTEQAVRSLVDALPYITYTVIQ